MKKYIIPSLLILVIAVVFGIGFYKPQYTEASVSTGAEYTSVETAGGQVGSSVINANYGTLGSVVITGANVGTFTLYDASTTNSALRTPINGSTATSSLRQIASFPSNAAVGTYTFDVKYYNGLAVEFLGGTATTTITYR